MNLDGVFFRAPKFELCSFTALCLSVDWSQSSTSKIFWRMSPKLSGRRPLQARAYRKNFSIHISKAECAPTLLRLVPYGSLKSRLAPMNGLIILLLRNPICTFHWKVPSGQHLISPRCSSYEKGSVQFSFWSFRRRENTSMSEFCRTPSGLFGYKRKLVAN